MPDKPKMRDWTEGHLHEMLALLAPALPNVGDTLGNDSTLLAIRTNDIGDHVVLCLLGTADRSFHKFATWYFNPDGGFCHIGDYFSTLEAAMADYTNGRH